MSVPIEKGFSIFCMPLNTSLKICVVIVVLVLTPCLFLLDVQELPRNFYKIPETTSAAPQLEIKNILYWTKIFDNNNFYFGDGDIFQHCEVSACRATHDRSFMEIRDFDALLFHGIEIKTSDLPPARSDKQKYIFVDFESPGHRPLKSAQVLDGFYNWTMTYRRDSDIPRTYGYLVDSVTDHVAYPIWARTDPVQNYTSIPNSSGNHTIFEGKRKSVAWFVSDCNTSGLRDKYVAELKKYVDVDIYGKCGTMTCSNRGTKCYEMLEETYYFYLSFENSLCQDYVTEKLYKPMAYNVVPIVYGGANYSDFAPPGSYINVLDFESPEQLANRLRYLIGNEEEYGKFFWWKKRFFIELGHRRAACEMCRILHNEEKLATREIPDLNKWWSEGKCLNSEEYLKKITQH